LEPVAGAAAAGVEDAALVCPLAVPAGCEPADADRLAAAPFADPEVEVRPLAEPVRALAFPLLAVPLLAVPVRVAVDPLRGLAPAFRVPAGARLVPEAGRWVLGVVRVLVVVRALVAARALLAVRTLVPLLVPLLGVAGAVALAAPAGSVVQFLNMKYCWPSVHTFVVTQ